MKHAFPNFWNTLEDEQKSDILSSLRQSSLCRSPYLSKRPFEAAKTIADYSEKNLNSDQRQLFEIEFAVYKCTFETNQKIPYLRDDIDLLGSRLFWADGTTVVKTPIHPIEKMSLPKNTHFVLFRHPNSLLPEAEPLLETEYQIAKALIQNPEKPLKETLSNIRVDDNGASDSQESEILDLLKRMIACGAIRGFYE